MRDFASSLLRWLTVTACGSIFSRRDEAEFPAASSGRARTCNLLERTSRGSPAADGAPSDALRLFNNRVNIQDQYELSFIWQAHAPFARRVPPQGRSPFAQYACGRESPSKDILAAAGRIFRKQQKHKENHNSVTQRLAAATASGA